MKSLISILACLFVAHMVFAAPTSEIVFPIDQIGLQQGCHLGSYKCGTLGEHHLAQDFIAPIPGTPIYSPVDGIVKDARLSDGYGGLVLIEFEVQDDTNILIYTAVLAHMYPPGVGGVHEMRARIGKQVTAGEIIGYIADDFNNGQGGPHLHYGIRKGSYSSGNTLDPCGKWKFAGYTPCSSVLSDWVDVMEFHKDHGDLTIGVRDGNNWVTGNYALPGDSEVTHRAHYQNAILGNKLCLNPNDNNGGGIYLHQWGSYSGLLIQDFNSCGGLQNGAIITREGTGKAYAVRGGFWNVYAGQNYGPQHCGAPTSEENPSLNGTWKAVQSFEDCILYWSPDVMNGQVLSSKNVSGGPPQVPSEFALSDSGILQIATGNTFPSGGEYGGVVEGSTFTLMPTSIAHNQVSLSFMNGPGLTYDELRVERNGVVIAYLSGTTTSITDTTVNSLTAYTYQVRGYVNGLGEIVYSQKLRVETSASPGTFEAIGNVRDSDTIDITLVDTLHTSAIAHRIYRDGMIVATTTGNLYADYFLTPSTTYSYLLEAITASGISLGFSPTIQLETDDPDGTEETLPPQGVPANPSVPLRLVEGVTVLEPISPVPHVISTCSRIAFILENVGTSSVFLDRVEAKATIVLDDGWGTVSRNFSPDRYQYPTPPLEILPGERYEYEGNNCDGSEWPALPGTATVVPMVKLYTVAGLIQITDIDPNTEYASFFILPSYTNPDFRVVDIRLNPSDPQDGDTISVDLDIKNDGDALVGTFITEITLPDGTTYNTTSPQALPGETKTTTIPLGTFSTSFNEVAYRLDQEDAHFEWDETDNNGLFYFGVRPKPFQCSDGIDNDNDGRIDWADGINQNPDPQCSGPTDNRENSEGPACGIGFEIAPFMIICVWLVRRKKLVGK